MSLKITKEISIPLEEIQFQAIRAQGAGGQNVNKLSSAIHLRFDIGASSLPDSYKARLGQLNDRRISSEGVIVIKAQKFRSLENNRADALSRLQELLQSAARQRKRRVPTRPTPRSREKRLQGKARRGQLKSQRSRISV